MNELAIVSGIAGIIFAIVGTTLMLGAIRCELAKIALELQWRREREQEPDQ